MEASASPVAKTRELFLHQQPLGTMARKFKFCPKIYLYFNQKSNYVLDLAISKNGILNYISPSYNEKRDLIIFEQDLEFSAIV